MAGPGSGKTLVITHRTKNLIEKYGVNPSNILVITFTKAAAVEMQERFEKLMDGQIVPVTFGTFHAIFFKILKYAYNYRAENILSEDIKYKIIREIVEKLQLEIEDINDFVNSIASEIGTVKGDMINISNYYSKNSSDSVFRKIYEEYEKKLKNNNKVDFDDMLIMCYELFSQRKDILGLWQNKYQYILIDEFQDINKVQFEVMKMLALPNNNLFIVGDDDQSIYRFRGAKPEIMLNFGEIYKDCVEILLDENYRSGSEIVKTSLRLIKNNNVRYKKDIKSSRGEGARVSIIQFKNVSEENDYLINAIKRKITQGVDYSSIAVLFRTNIGPRFLVDKLMEYNIPFHMKDVMPNIYEHFISKNIISYINIACRSGKREDYLSIINRPNRYISREVLCDEEISISNIKKHFYGKQWMIERLEKLEYDLSQIARMSPYAAIVYIRQGMGYDKYLEEYAAFRKMKVEELYEIVNEIAEAAKEYNTFTQWFQHIEKYTKELIVQSKKNRNNKSGIELSTMHSSKGLEYDTVFVIDAVEGVIPHTKAVLDEDIEEERRLFYVALTRAKNSLNIYSVEERFNKPVSISRFVGELKVDYDEIVSGTEVSHKKYGKGIIKNVDEKRVCVYFGKLRKELVFDKRFAFSNEIIRIAEK